MYNTIYADVVMDDYSIQTLPKNMKTRFFNDNLVLFGGDYVLDTPESSVINILSMLAEKEGLSNDK